MNVKGDGDGAHETIEIKPQGRSLYYWFSETVLGAGKVPGQVLNAARHMHTTLLPEPIHVSTGAGAGYEVVFAPLEEAPRRIEDTGIRHGRCLLVTDENVASLHADRLLDVLSSAGWAPTVIVVPPGEETKSSSVLEEVYDRALAAGIDRATPLFAIGGGVVGDLAGYAAATLLRGIPLVHFPTTLVAQVDSAIGGKTGINHGRGKNLIGAFHQPRLVLSDLTTLDTLSNREWTSGLAEVVKHGLISDAELFDFLEASWDDIIERDPSTIHRMVPQAVRVKTAVVQTDERESGLRATLNFGHTFGHAIERIAGYGRFTHGEAVAVGMEVALYLSHDFRPDLQIERALDLVRRIPVAGDPADLSFDALYETMLVDKKTQQGRIRFVLLEHIGRSYVRSDL